MENTNDRTAELFDWLGITPDGHSWAYFVNSPNPFVSWRAPHKLLSNTLEADGLAVKLYMLYLMREKSPIVIKWSGYHGQFFIGDDTYLTFSHAVHAVLCMAMDAEKQS